MIAKDAILTGKIKTKQKKKTIFGCVLKAAPTLSITSVRYIYQMADAHKEEEQVQLLGEEMRANAQAQNLKLG